MSWSRSTDSKHPSLSASSSASSLSSPPPSSSPASSSSPSPPRDPDFPPTLRQARILLATESLGPVNGVSRTTASLIEYLRVNEVDLVVVAPYIANHQTANITDHHQTTLRLPGAPLPYNPDLTVVYPFHIDRLGLPFTGQTHQSHPDDPVPRRPDLVYLASPASIGFQLLLQLHRLDAPPPILLNFQTDLSAYSEILLPPFLARAFVALLASVQGLLFRQPAVHTVFYPCSDIRRYLEQDAGVPAARLVQLGRGVDTILFHPSHRAEPSEHREHRAIPKVRANEQKPEKDLEPVSDREQEELAQPYLDRKQPDEILLICVCRLAPEKGLDFLADVAIDLVTAGLPFRLLIVGGNRNPAVEDDVRRRFAPVHDHVVFTGFLTGVALARAYASSDLFLHCSVTETFGLVVLEAMASGLPVVARNRGGPSDIIRHGQTGYLISPEDLDDFVGRVLHLSQDTALRTRLSIAARRFAEDTTWEKINRRVAVQLAEALAKQQQPTPQLDASSSPSSPHPVGFIWQRCIGFLKRTLERFRLQLAVGVVRLLWIISVVPLILHGNRIFRQPINNQPNST